MLSTNTLQSHGVPVTPADADRLDTKCGVASPIRSVRRGLAHLQARLSPIQRVHLPAAGMESPAGRQAQIRLQRSNYRHGVTLAALEPKLVPSVLECNNKAASGSAYASCSHAEHVPCRTDNTATLHVHNEGFNGGKPCAITERAIDNLPTAQEWLSGAASMEAPVDDALDLGSDAVPEVKEAECALTFRLPTQARVSLTPTNHSSFVVERPKPIRPHSALSSRAASDATLHGQVIKPVAR